eukprot:TRINITY_DN8805_c0_g3_i1.p1 TRINITY_DN8805_c0_g3~~TRINITY_DN8805_c0_g3_i1.p1  ORF type:complete len:676 (+),score=125.28 TRINITY_DN8805_c0_g3_i1:51-2078(+)
MPIIAIGGGAGGGIPVGDIDPDATSPASASTVVFRQQSYAGSETSRLDAAQSSWSLHDPLGSGSTKQSGRDTSCNRNMMSEYAGRRSYAEADHQAYLQSAMTTGTSHFISGAEAQEDMDSSEGVSAARRLAWEVTRSQHYEVLSGVVVFIDFVAICRDADSRAAAETGTDILTLATMKCCFVFYVVDLALRAFARGLSIMKKPSNILDLFIIAVSVLEQLLEFVQSASKSDSLITVRMTRMCRMLRLVRVTKLLAGLKELRLLVQLVATCGKTMFWSFLLSLLVMSMWALLAVELVHPVAQRLAERGTWADCARCDRAFESVMASNLTFWQTILAGDSWGLLALPIMEEEPSTAIVFCGCLLSLTYGIMQLITAVVVDSVAMSRQQDVNSLADEMTQLERAEKEQLTKMFEQIDVDANGYMTLQELIFGATRIKPFQDWLRVTDVDSHDLNRLFKLLDLDDDGQVSLVDFIHTLYRLKHGEINTTAKLTKHSVESLEKVSEELVQEYSALKNGLHEIQKRQLQLQRQLDQHSWSKSRTELESAVRKACIVAMESVLHLSLDQNELTRCANEQSQKGLGASNGHASKAALASCVSWAPTREDNDKAPEPPSSVKLAAGQLPLTRGDIVVVDDEQSPEQACEADSRAPGSPRNLAECPVEGGRRDRPCCDCNNGGLR